MKLICGYELQIGLRLLFGTFPAAALKNFQRSFALDWENYLPLKGAFSISKAKCVKSKTS